MTRRPVAFFDLTAADYDDLDAAVEAIIAVVLEWRPAIGQAMDEGNDPVGGYRSGLATRSAP